MIQLLLHITLLGLAPVAATPALANGPEILAYVDITAADARELLYAPGADVVFVDVREDYEYNGVNGHVPGAINMPWNSGYLENNYQDELQPLDRTLIVYCASGGRSRVASQFLDDNGYTDVRNMGAYSAWLLLPPYQLPTAVRSKAWVLYH